MSVAIPVIPYRANLLSDEQELYQFLLTCQEQLERKGNSHIVSFSQEIDLIDPLAVFSAIAQANQVHFYWENRNKGEAILGYGIAKSLFLETGDRFSQSQQFIQDCFKQIIRRGDLQLAGSEPHIFCGFTFFSSALERDTPFPVATLFLPQLQIIKKQNTCVLSINLTIDKQAKIKFLFEQIKKIIKTLTISRKNVIPLPTKSQILSQQAKIHSAYNFKSSVASALQSIEDNQFSKIVLAHTLDIISPRDFDIVESLNNLRKNYPDCYTFSLSNGRGSYFIGASPERLISIQNQQLVTDALAGSAPRGKTAAEDVILAKKLLRSEKERREHQAVIEFIIQRLYQLNLTPQRSPLKLLQLSNIQHLWTPIYAQLKSDIHALEIVAKLHPTPAVAGVPSQVACEHIRHYETFDRSLYAAPIGWVDAQGNSEFIVSIRSALIAGNQARLYAGAGIVAGSNPNKELAEIQLKFQALLKALL